MSIPLTTIRSIGANEMIQAIEFLGTWSNYPYFKSGNILVNSIERGVFTLKYTGRKAKYTGGRKSEWMEKS